MFELPKIDAGTPETMLADTAKLAMTRLDAWAAEADAVLTGREVVATKGPAQGRLGTITGVIVCATGDKYHLCVRAETRGREIHNNGNRLLTLGVNCELIAIDDTPTGDI
ncbi:hypothetical protein BD1_46 [Octadecabacter Antarctic BD virus 1]|nr:hypothetical protein BD1_46 [Octadecabacter Antarctic BD virus 1]